MKMKKLLAAALAATMIFSSMVTSFVASAASVGTITAGDVTVCPGNEAAVDVDVTIEFDEAVVAPHNIVTVAIAGYDLKEVTNIATEKTGDGNVTVDADGSNLAEGKILLEAPVDEMAPTVTKITFTAKFEANGEEKGTDIVVNGDDMTDISESEIGIDADNGKLTIAHVEEAIAGKDATCTETGLTEGAKCSVCGTVTKEQDTIDALGHKEEVIPPVDATCTETGLTAGAKCSVCGTVTKEQETVDAIGHDWDDGVIDPDATCTDDGVKTFTCANCGETKTEAVSAKGHTEVDVDAVAPTCTATGLTAGKKCSVCGAFTVAQTEVPALGHDFGENLEYCANNCGTANPNYVPPVTEPVEDATIVVRDAVVSITSTLDMRIRVRKSVIPADCVRAEVIATPTIYDSSYNTTPGTPVVASFEMATASSNLTMYPKNFSLFSLDLPMYVQIKCYDANGNLYKYSPTYTYYPADALKAQYLASPSKDSEKKLNTVITDMLNMSAKAQTYFASNAGASSALKATVTAGNLVNKDWPQDYASTTEPTYNTVDTKIYGEGFNDSDNELRIAADLSGAPILSYSLRKATTAYPDTSKLTMTVSYTSYYGKANGGEVVSDTIEGVEWAQYASGKHLVYKFRDCAMYDGNKTITVVVNYDGKEVVRSEYSLESYIAANSIGDTALANCLKSMGIFGASARAYFSTLGTVDPA